MEVLLEGHPPKKASLTLFDTFHSTDLVHVNIILGQYVQNIWTQIDWSTTTNLQKPLRNGFRDH